MEKNKPLDEIGKSLCILNLFLKFKQFFLDMYVCAQKINLNIPIYKNQAVYIFVKYTVPAV